MNRRRFITALAAGSAGAALLPASAIAAGETRLVILHTNDTHSHIDPFPMDGGRLQGLGGVARRKSLIEQIRRENRHVLLVDSGDIFQGTPYFNFFHGEIEFKAMSMIGYDFATLGNHDFDNGVKGLAAMLPYADFEFVSANYDVTQSPLEGRIRSYATRSFGPLKVGIFGLGISFERLVLPALHEGVAYHDPIEAARQTVEILRRQGCSLIVCLSHLGYKYGDDQISDTILAREVPEIDLILGGHTHTFMNHPDVFAHSDSRTTIVHQVGWGGVRLGRIDLAFGSNGQIQRWASGSVPVDGRFDHA